MVTVIEGWMWWCVKWFVREVQLMDVDQLLMMMIMMMGNQSSNGGWYWGFVK